MGKVAKGRPRKPAVSRSKGRIVKAQRTPMDDPLAIVFAQRRRDGAKKGEERDQRNGYALGRLWRDGKLTPPFPAHITGETEAHAQARHDAGQAFATLAARFRVHALSGKPTPPAANMETLRAFSSRDTEPAQWRALREEYDAATKALPRINLALMWGLLILDDEPAEHQVSAVRFGLACLANHFGIWPALDSSLKRA